MYTPRVDMQIFTASWLIKYIYVRKLVSLRTSSNLV